MATQRINQRDAAAAVAMIDRQAKATQPRTGSAARYTQAWRASEARAGAALMRSHYAPHGAMSTENARYWAEAIADGTIHRDGRTGVMGDVRHDTQLPQAAFDWPIYRAALGGRS